MKLGVGSYTWPWAVGIEGYLPAKPIDIPEILRRAKELDVEVVQLADKPHLHELNNEDLSGIKSMADNLGLKLEAGTRGVDPKHLTSYLEIAKKLNSKIVRTVVPAINPDTLSSIKKIIPLYEKEDITIAIENHDEHSAEEMMEFIREVNSKNMGVCLDTLNSLGALESPKTTIEKLGPYTASLHIKDFEIFRADHQLGFIVEGRPAGTGMLNIEWTIKYLKENKRYPNVILELWTPYTGTVEHTIKKENEWAISSIRYLKKILG